MANRGHPPVRSSVRLVAEAGAGFDLPMRITRHFVTFAGRQVHYRHAGAGPAVVLLHQSPTSSRELEPLIAAPAERGLAVFAPDMAGFGLSDPHPRGLGVEIPDLADDVAAFLDAVGIARAGIYGFHTGGCIANEFARRHPARATTTIVGGFVCLTDDERRDILANYLPPFVPLNDGTHLAWLWYRVKEQKIFFPWYRSDEDARMSIPVGTPAQLHATAMSFLDAGDAYRGAYGAAFRYRGQDSLPHIRGAHYIVSYEADPLDRHLARLPPLADNIRIERCATPALATDKVIELLLRHRAEEPAPLPPAAAMLRGQLAGDYAGAMRLRCNDDAGGVPLLLLHGAGESGRAFEPLAATLMGRRSLLVPDLPLHGDSDALEAENAAQAVAAMLAARGVELCDVFAQGSGTAVALELAALVPAKLRRLVLHEMQAFAPDLAQALRDQDAPALEPDFHGGHLSRAWHVARDRGLFFPWFDRRGETRIATQVAPHEVHRRAVDLLKAGAAAAAMSRAALDFDFRTGLARVSQPVRLCATASDPVQRVLFGRDLFRLPDSREGWAPLLAAWFEP